MQEVASYLIDAASKKFKSKYFKSEKEHRMMVMTMVGLFGNLMYMYIKGNYKKEESDTDATQLYGIFLSCPKTINSLYTNLTRRNADMDNDRYLWLVTSKPNPGREEEYNEWYDKHVETFFKFPGLKKVVRNKCFQSFQNPDSCPQYVVSYEFDTRDDLEAFLSSDAAEIAKKQFEEEWNGLGEFLWSGWYEPVKKLEK